MGSTITVAVILKAVTVILGLVVTVVGCNAILNSELYGVKKGFSLSCELVPNCPDDWLARERYFVAATIITLILSMVSIVLEFVTDTKNDGVRTVDAIYQIIGGLMLLIASALLIATTRQIDSSMQNPEYDYYDVLEGKASSTDKVPGGGFSFKQNDSEDYFIDEVHKFLKYPDKLAAGSLGIINSVLYFVTAVFVFRSKAA